jgi:hypothetical protein
MPCLSGRLPEADVELEKTHIIHVNSRFVFLGTESLLISAEN